MPALESLKKEKLSALVQVLLKEAGSIKALALTLGVKSPTVMLWRDGKAVISGNNRSSLVKWLKIRESTFGQFLDGALTLDELLSRRGETARTQRSDTLDHSLSKIELLIEDAPQSELVACLPILGRMIGKVGRSLETKINSEPSTSIVLKNTEENLQPRVNVALHTQGTLLMQNPLPGSFAAFVKIWMDAAGLSQEEFEASILRLGDRSLSLERMRQIQQGEATPNYTELATIAYVLRKGKEFENGLFDIRGVARFYGVVDAPDEDNNENQLDSHPNDSLNFD